MSERSRGRETILVVDAEAASRASVCRTLRAEGYVVIPAGLGPEAHWCVERHGSRVQLLLAQLAAPEADEYHLGIPIGRLFPGTPVIFTSSEPREHHVRRGLLHPSTPFLRTPCPPALLARTVRRVLDRPGLPLLM